MPRHSKTKGKSKQYYTDNADNILAALNEGQTLKEWTRRQPINKIIAEYEAKQDESNAANEERYQQGLGVWDQILDVYSGMETGIRAPAELDMNFGQAQRRTIERGRNRNIASGSQALVSSGLYNSTIRPGMIRAANELATTQGLQLDEDIFKYRQGRADLNYQRNLDSQGLRNQRRAGIGGAMQGRVGFIERKEDIGPDWNQFASQINLAAQGPLKLRGVSAKYRKRAIKGLTRAGVNTTGRIRNAY